MSRYMIETDWGAVRFTSPQFASLRLAEEFFESAAEWADRVSLWMLDGDKYLLQKRHLAPCLVQDYGEDGQ